MKKKKNRKIAFEHEHVDASPVKSFFVHMLTRDIELEFAIFDLLDNCIDGILRSRIRNIAKKKPYHGFKAEINFKKDSFSIADNCGGIPWALHNYAFRMGRPKKHPEDTRGMVGVYGIGMKRAIFKMGKHCLISTQNGNQCYEVEITPKWISDEEKWSIPVRAAGKKMEEDGTTIVIGELHDGIRKRFSENPELLKSELNRMIARYYAFIIEKGFEVVINGDTVKPRPTRLIFQKTEKGKKPAIQPYIFKTKTADGVEIFLAVGFIRRIPSQDEIENEQEETKYSSLDAGWTVICNDRAVLYCDRSELTGWGEARVPRYHTQFIAISGIVEFKANDASKLPMTTTKRGIDASSILYLQIKNKMREGMRIFTDYTNKWKGKAAESKKQIECGKPYLFKDIKRETESLKFIKLTRSVPKGYQYKPTLPYPKQLMPNRRRISFVRHADDVKIVAEFLLGDVNADASEVGERCFDTILKEAKQ